MENIRLRREAFRAFCQANGGVASVARASGIPATTLYSYLDETTRSLKGETQRRIAAAFNISELELYAPKIMTTCPVVGKIELGRGLMFFEGNVEEFEYVERPPFADEKTVALRIVPTEISDAFDGWTLFYNDEKRTPGPQHLNQLCMVWLDDGRTLCRWLRLGDEPGTYNLTGQASGPVKNVIVRYASKVLGMTPPTEN